MVLSVSLATEIAKLAETLRGWEFRKAENQTHHDPFQPDMREEHYPSI
jgi:hypothetical protein